MNDNRTNLEYERDECSGMARFLGVFLIPLALIGLLASAPAWGQSNDWQQLQINTAGQSTGGYNDVYVFGRKGASYGPSLTQISRGLGYWIDDVVRAARTYFSEVERATMYSRYPQITWGEGYPGHPGRATVNRCSNC